MIPHSLPSITSLEREAITRVLEAGTIATGPEIEEFEQAVAEYVGQKHAVAVSNGSAALFLSLLSQGIGAGDEVVIPASVCAGVMHAIEHTGAQPIIGDTETDTLNLDFEDTLRLVTSRTRAIVLPHMFGEASNLDAFQSLNVPLIEDCAQSLGGEYSGAKQGSFGHHSVFSFYATKIITSIDGGMVLTNDLQEANAVRDLRYYGGKTNYATRYNFKLQNLNAAIGLTQLLQIDHFIAQRRKQWEIISEIMSTIRHLRVLNGKEYSGSARYKLLVQILDCNARKIFEQIAARHAISTGRAILVNLAEMKYGAERPPLKNTVLHSQTTYSFPIYPGLDLDAIKWFLDDLREALGCVEGLGMQHQK